MASTAVTRAGFPAADTIVGLPISSSETIKRRNAAPLPAATASVVAGPCQDGAPPSVPDAESDPVSSPDRRHRPRQVEQVVTWPVGYRPNMARRHSIMGTTDTYVTSRRSAGGAMLDALEGGEAVRSGKFVIDERLKIGSTSLVHGWDGSVAPMARLTAQVVDPENYADFLQHEGRVLMILRSAPHRNLPSLVACRDPGNAENSGNGHIFFNPMFGDLYSEARAPKSLPEMLRIFEQMVAPVAHCHSLRVVLGNIKLGKFMWADRDHTTVQLADLSGSQVVDDSGRCSVERASGSPAYIAPEVLGENAHYNGFAADMWALGVVCFILLTGSYPFEDTSSTKLFKKIKDAAVEYPPELPEAVVQMLQQLLCRDPMDRITASQLAVHPVLKAARLERQRRWRTKEINDQTVPSAPETYAEADTDSSGCKTPPSSDVDDSGGSGQHVPASTVTRDLNRRGRHSRRFSQKSYQGSSLVPRTRRWSTSPPHSGGTPRQQAEEKSRRWSSCTGLPQIFSETVENDATAVRRCSPGSKRGSWCAALADYEHSTGGKLETTGELAARPKRANSLG